MMKMDFDFPEPVSLQFRKLLNGPIVVLLCRKEIRVTKGGSIVVPYYIAGRPR
jgi:hypothetical protein